VLSFLSEAGEALAVRRREFITIIGGGGEDNLTRYDLTPVRGLGCWGWVLASPAEHVTGSVKLHELSCCT